jgi:hypothetical protein
VTSLLEFIYDYDRLCLTTDDFIKRKRIKKCNSGNKSVAKFAVPDMAYPAAFEVPVITCPVESTVEYYLIQLTHLQ